MKKLKLFVTSLLLILMTSTVIGAFPVQGATPAQIQTAIVNGIAWLAADQEADGSWPSYYGDVATTGLAVLKLEHYAYELGYTSPFDPAYPYHQEVEDGLDYLFGAGRMFLTTMTLQDHTAGATGTVDDPDTLPDTLGVYAQGSYPVYDTGIVLAAVSASGTPLRVVNVAGSVVNTWTYFDVAQDMVDYLAWAQSDLDYAPYGMGEGGWTYTPLNNAYRGGSYGTDQSNNGYAVLGLAYATDFGCTVPTWVKTELNAYIDDIQDPVNGDARDGGSWYGHQGDTIGVNILKTGNLIFEMALVGDTPTTPRVVDALDYLARTWGAPSGANSPPGWDGNPAQYQTMFCAMKGLEYMGITVFNSIDWYADFADAIVTQQSGSGAWTTSSGRGTPTIITAWALLTLERAARAPEAPVAIFTESAHTVTAGTPITFNPSGSYDLDGTIVLYEFDFESDGTYDVSNAVPTVVTHTYFTPGPYTVTLRVTDNDGLTDITADTKTILLDDLQVIPEVPLGTLMLSAAMIIGLACYITIPKIRKKTTA
ncbi:MAG: PKD domain-containing protein [Candidatus Hodarchaeales archaeon]|jgi:hypothetical protein